MQEACADKPIEVIVPAEEEVKVKPTVFSQRSREDYYGSLSNPCRDSYNSDAHMDSLKVNTELFSPCFTLFMHSCCNPKQPDHVFFFFCFLFFQQPESEESPQARYPQPPSAPPLPSASSTSAQPEKPSVSRIEHIQIATSGEKNIFVYLI